MTREELQKERNPRSLIHSLVTAGVRDGTIFRRFAIWCAWGVMYMTGDDPRCREALEVAKRHSTGDATNEELAAAADAAAAARDETIDQWKPPSTLSVEAAATINLGCNGGSPAFATYLARRAVWAATKPSAVFAAIWAAEWAADAMMYNVASTQIVGSREAPYAEAIGAAKTGAHQEVGAQQCQFLRECLTWEALGKLCPEFATA
jgi:hypothetical protein